MSGQPSAPEQTLNGMWESLEDVTISPFVTPEFRALLRRYFYAGAAAFSTVLVANGPAVIDAELAEFWAEARSQSKAEEPPEGFHHAQG